MSRQEEIGRFSTNGKTFFFNKASAKNGTDYLAINALYGKGNRERLILFQPHMIQFWKWYVKSVEEITGLLPGHQTIRETCPDCGSVSEDWRPLSSEDGSVWCIVCLECRWVVFENVTDAYRKISNE